MTNLEMYLPLIMNEIEECVELGEALESVYFSITNGGDYQNTQAMLKWYSQECKELLTLKEKEFLKLAIALFKGRVAFIWKEDFYSSEYGEDRENINIQLKQESDSCTFPSFPYGKYYKNMVPNKEYSLKELGLDN